MFGRDSANGSARLLGDHVVDLMNAGTAKEQPERPSPALTDRRAQATNPFQRFYALGYRSLVPLIPVGAPISPRSSLALRLGPGHKDPRGKAPGVLTELGWSGYSAWTDDTDATPADLIRWHAMGADVGLRMGGRTRFLGIDCDTTCPKLSAQIWHIAQAHFPGAHAKRTGRAPKWAQILRVSGDERVPFRFVEFTGKDGAIERVEALSNGKQLKVAGLHPTTGASYTWDPDVPAYDDIVEATTEQIAAFFTELERTLPGANRVRVEGTGEVRSIASLRGDPEMIEAAVRRLPNTTAAFPTREDHVGIGYAIKAAIADESRALACFIEWSDRWEDHPEGKRNDYGYAEAVWRTLHPKQKGAGWLLNKLEAVTGEPVANHWFGPIEMGAPSLWDAAPPDPSHVRPAFELVHCAIAAASALEALARPLIKGLLDCSTLSVLYGPSGAGKTFAALDIAFHVATGMNWNGMRVQKETVVYLAAEGGRGAMKRIQALKLRFGLDLASVPLHFRLANIDLFHPNADLGPAIYAINEIGRVGLVVVDTLSAVFAGGDENSPVDMGILVKNLNKLRAATDAHVLNVHHTGKDEARGARGHSLLKAALDTELEVLNSRLSATKQREIETNLQIGFELSVVRLGVDEDGDPVTSCVVRWEPPTAISNLTEKEALVLTALQAVAAQIPAGDARPEALADHLAGVKITMKADSARKHLINLVKKGLAISAKRGRWSPKIGNSSLPTQAPPLAISATSPQASGKELEIDIFA